ncbi:MAG: hypothetical protein R2739_02030 [Chitinophagales bacterium]
MTKEKRIYYILVSSCLLVLGVSGWKWALGLQGNNDILFADEAEYLRNGLNLFGEIAKNWGPTYNLWYKFLSIYSTDPITLYYFNYKIGAIAVGILLFIFLLRYNVHILVAFLIAFCYQFSDVNIIAWPRISNFVLILYFLFFIFIKKEKSFLFKLIWFSIVTFIAAFARPELLIIAEICSVVVLVLFIRKYNENKANILSIFLLLAVAVILFLVYGKPADTYSNINRMYIAFCQHFAVAYKMRTQSDINPIINWIEITRPFFGDCKTVPEILLKHFSLCIPHFLFTIKFYFLSFLQYVAGFVTPLFFIPGNKKKLILTLLVFAFLIIVLFNKSIRQSFLQKIKDNKIILGLSFLFSLPSIGICIVIFPRQHYMMLQAIWIALLLGFLLSAVLEKFSLKDFYVIPLAIFLLLISPRADKYHPFDSVPDIKNLCSQKFVHYMNAQTWNGKYTILSNVLNVHLLLDDYKKFDQFNTEYMLKQLPDSVTFNDILQEKHINIIMMNNELLQEKKLQHDSTWLNLIAHPENYGFEKVVYANECQNYLLIKR